MKINVRNLLFACAVLSGSCIWAISADVRSEATFTWRVHVDMWEDEGNFREFVEFARARKLTGKIAFFTCDFHTPPRPELLLPRIAKLTDRIAEMKRLGYSAGVNHLVTLGHVDEELDRCLDIPEARRFTDFSGATACANYCPNDPVWRMRYVRPVYEALARTGADFIWTDDDIRLQNHGVKGCGCYCETCMGLLRERLGYDGDREGLGAWFEDPREGDARRRRFLQFRRETVSELLGFVARVIREVDPRIVVGVMDCGSHDHLPCPEKFAALDGAAYPVYWRPGGGLYTDLVPDAILTKLNSLARECAYIPSGVRDLEAELEDFNYQRLRKSVHFNRLEAESYAAVCTPGVAYNVFCEPKLDDLEVSDEVVSALEQDRSRIESLVAATGRKPCRGVFGVFGRDAALGTWGGNGREWLLNLGRGWVPSFESGDLQRIGIPVAYRADQANVYAADEKAVRMMSDGEIGAMLSKGVYLSGEAVEELIRRGFGEDVGFDVVGRLSKGAMESFVAHPLNRGLDGKLRDARQSFWGGTATMLRPHAGARVVSRAVRITGDELAPCVSGTYENRRGGRVFVAGYFAWDRLMWRSKTTQLKRVFRWLSSDTLPGYVEGFHRIALWVRGPDTVVLLNMSADPARNVRLMLTGSVASPALGVVGEDGGPVLSGVKEGCYRRYGIPELKPWSVMVLAPVTAQTDASKQ